MDLSCSSLTWLLRMTLCWLPCETERHPTHIYRQLHAASCEQHAASIDLLALYATRHTRRWAIPMPIVSFFLIGAIHKPIANSNQVRLLTPRRSGTSPLNTARPPALCILTCLSKLLLSSIITRTHSEACLRSSSIRVFASASSASVSTHLEAGPRSSSMTLFASTSSATVQQNLSCNVVMMARSNSARVLLRARSSVCDAPLRDLGFSPTVAVAIFSRTAEVADCLCCLTIVSRDGNKHKSRINDRRSIAWAYQ